MSGKVYVAVRQTTIKLRLESKTMCFLHPQQPQPHPYGDPEVIQAHVNRERWLPVPLPATPSTAKSLRFLT